MQAPRLESKYNLECKKRTLSKMKDLVLSGIIKEPEANPSHEKAIKRTLLELLTEYFGFYPIDFVDDIINTVNSLLYNAMDELEKILLKEFHDKETVEKEFFIKSNNREWLR